MVGSIQYITGFLQRLGNAQTSWDVDLILMGHLACFLHKLKGLEFKFINETLCISAKGAVQRMIFVWTLGFCVFKSVFNICLLNCLRKGSMLPNQSTPVFNLTPKE